MQNETYQFHARGRLNSDEYSVRESLQELRTQLGDAGVPGSDLDVVELVLAEVMNNVVEHAHRGMKSGHLSYLVEPKVGALKFTVEDDGVPMPGEQLPCGVMADLPEEAEDMPEGGFGWFLVHTLARDLTYVRDGAINRLTFQVPTAVL